MDLICPEKTGGRWGDGNGNPTVGSRLTTAMGEIRTWNGVQWLPAALLEGNFINSGDPVIILSPVYRSQICNHLHNYRG